jgi:hypothetical protein
MKKLIIYSLFILLSASYTLFSFSGNGSGTEADPYQITTVEQLQEMNDDLDAHYILMNDIDASDTENWNVKDHDNDPNTPDSAMGFEPIGKRTWGAPEDGFTGKLNGQGYSISFLYSNRPSQRDIGLFGCLSDGSYAYDINIVESSVTGYGDIGIFVGMTYAFDQGSEVLIERCSSSGSARGYNCIGGFCGINYAKNGTTTIRDCYSTGLAFGDQSIGGFCGGNEETNEGSAIIKNCFSIGSATGNWMIGGFCGYNESDDGTAIISECYSEGNAYGNKEVGGFCGSMSANFTTILIKNCYCMG